MKMFQSTKKNGNPILYLIYKYGTNSDDDMITCSLFKEEGLIAVDIGIERGWNKIPRCLQKKIDNQKILTDDEEFQRAALEDFEKERKLPASDRISWIFVVEPCNFREYFYDDEESDDDNFLKKTFITPQSKRKKSSNPKSEVKNKDKILMPSHQLLDSDLGALEKRSNLEEKAIDGPLKKCINKNNNSTISNARNDRCLPYLGQTPMPIAIGIDKAMLEEEKKKPDKDRLKRGVNAGEMLHAKKRLKVSHKKTLR